MSRSADGEQQAGAVFTEDDKVRIAEKLAEVGVHRIEAGMPAVSPPDEAAIKEIVKRNLGPEIFCFTRCMVDDVKKAVDCGVKGIVIEIPASARSGRACSRSGPLKRPTSTSPSRQHLSPRRRAYIPSSSRILWHPNRYGLALNLVNRVARAEGHMDAFTLVDTFGVLSPQGATYFTRKIKENVKKPLEIHFHSDFGLGVAHTLMAVLSGVEALHTTIGGIGERCGNAPMEETVFVLLTFYGIDVGIDYSKLNEALSKLVTDLSGIEVPENRPFIGSKAYSVEWGIVTSWFKNAFERKTSYYRFSGATKFVGHDMPEIFSSWGRRVGLTTSRSGQRSWE